MERVWMLGRLAVTVARIDFSDPALGDAPGVRERGVRLELRPAYVEHTGSAYASPAWTLRPALCRIDLLESAPGAGDRMHWHPVMDDGEPGDRVFEPAMVDDPGAWLSVALADPRALLTRAGETVDADLEADLDALGRCRDEIVRVVTDDLADLRRPWPDVVHDHRGLAPA